MNKIILYISVILFMFLIINTNSTFAHNGEQHLKNEHVATDLNSKEHEEGSGFKSYLKKHWNYKGHDSYKSQESSSKNLEEGSTSSTKEKNHGYNEAHDSYESNKSTFEHQKEGSSNH